jgi:hypothetical protein
MRAFDYFSIEFQVFMLKDDKKPPVGFSITISFGARVQITFIFNLGRRCGKKNFVRRIYKARHDLSCAKTDINYIQREREREGRER